MKLLHLLSIGVLALYPAGMGLAQRALPRGEILEMLTKLTDEPRQTWIAAGTIEARHQEYGAPQTTEPATIDREIQEALEQYRNDPDKRELTEETRRLKLEAIPFNVRYKLANEHTMRSRVLVRYDGARFYWEINLEDRQDSVRPEARLAGNYMLDRFDVDGNARRIFAWDGQRYTTYAVSGNEAFVDVAGTLPRAVNGPLTAGLIPWGYGRFGRAALADAELAATEVPRDGTARIEMNIAYADGAAARLVLDPAQDYAVTDATLTGRGGDVAHYLCTDYRLVGRRHVPFMVGIERRDGATNSLRGAEQWTFTAVSAAEPAPDSFAVPYAANAIVEYGLPPAGRHLMCDYSPTADLDALLAQRLACAAARDEPRNCATIALQYAVAKLGKSTHDQALVPLIGLSGQTTLRDMKHLARELGLHCRAVKTDLATLREQTGAVAILHLPGRNHFVVLDEIEDRYVWLIDLAHDKFYYRHSVDSFPAEWSQGTALLLSSQPIGGPFAELDDAACARICGSAGWACTLLIQRQTVETCAPTGGCEGTYIYHWEHYGCESAPSGTCANQLMVRYQESPCVEDLPYGCMINGQWTYYYMLACE